MIFKISLEISYFHSWTLTVFNLELCLYEISKEKDKMDTKIFNSFIMLNFKTLYLLF